MDWDVKTPEPEKGTYWESHVIGHLPQLTTARCVPSRNRHVPFKIPIADLTNLDSGNLWLAMFSKQPMNLGPTAECANTVPNKVDQLFRAPALSRSQAQRSKMTTHQIDFLRPITICHDLGDETYNWDAAPGMNGRRCNRQNCSNVMERPQSGRLGFTNNIDLHHTRWVPHQCARRRSFAGLITDEVSDRARMQAANEPNKIKSWMT